MLGVLGKFLVVIYLILEVIKGGMIGKIRNGDMIIVDWIKDIIYIEVDF